MTRRDGSVRWIRVEAIPLFVGGTVDRVFVTLCDTTALHEGNAELRNERRRLARAGDRFRSLLESVPDAIAVYHENRFGYGNAALVSMFGYQSAAELVGREVTKVLPGHVPGPKKAPGQPAELREESWQTANGKIAIVEIATHAFALDDEEATLLIARDITDRKRAQEQLMLTGRLASVGTLAAGVAHEINNPLCYVIANLDLMADGIAALDRLLPPGSTGDLCEMAADARTGADRVRKIVRGMKMFARADEERVVSLDVHSALDSSAEMAFNEIKHRARLVKDYGTVPFVMADEGRLGQVFINLLVNAAQSIPDGRADANEVRIITSTDDTGRAVIVIRDTGAGIPQGVIGRVFDPFFTTKPIGLGTGLGLSICHGIVAALGGELSVESTVGVGTSFRVVLPAAALDSLIVPKSVPPVSAIGPSGRVLGADDDAMVGEALRRLLGREHDIVTVTDARDALARVVRGERFDVILCDLMMPLMTGMEFHSELRRISPGLADRIVFVTGGAFTAEARTFLALVHNPIVEKPYDNEKLRTLVNDLVRAASSSPKNAMKIAV